jgi:hypothetical protein
MFNLPILVKQREDAHRDAEGVGVREDAITKVLTAWLVPAERDRQLPGLELSFFDDRDATLYTLTAADGALATQAIVLMDQLIDRQRAKVAQWEEFTRIGLFLDEITNTPIPRLPPIVLNCVVWVA